MAAVEQLDFFMNGAGFGGEDGEGIWEAGIEGAIGDEDGMDLFEEGDGFEVGEVFDEVVGQDGGDRFWAYEGGEWGGDEVGDDIGVGGGIGVDIDEAFADIGAAAEVQFGGLVWGHLVGGWVGVFFDGVMGGGLHAEGRKGGVPPLIPYKGRGGPFFPRSNALFSHNNLRKIKVLLQV